MLSITCDITTIDYTTLERMPMMLKGSTSNSNQWINHFLPPRRSVA